MKSECPICKSTSRRIRRVVRAELDIDGPAWGDCEPVMLCNNEWHRRTTKAPRGQFDTAQYPSCDAAGKERK